MSEINYRNIPSMNVSRGFLNGVPDRFDQIHNLASIDKNPNITHTYIHRVASLNTHIWRVISYSYTNIQYNHTLTLTKRQ